MTTGTGPRNPSGAAPEVVFIPNAIPPLRDGMYVLSATQTIPDQDPGTFAATASFVVSGERFTISPAEIDSVFPPNLANGEFSGVLAHVVFNRRTLPWERSIDPPETGNHPDPPETGNHPDPPETGNHPDPPETGNHPDAPWLAILICDDKDAPKLTRVTAKDLVPPPAPITVQGSKVTATGTLPATALSYGAGLLGLLEYGETPEDPCTVIDLPVTTFNQIAPAAADLRYLAHIREVDLSDGLDSPSTSTSEQHAVVFANRVPSTSGVTRAFLVSLEGMADYLPKRDGTCSDAMAALTDAAPAGAVKIDTVRLIVYLSWTFAANDMGEALKALLEDLNARPDGGMSITTLRLPIVGDPPSAPQVAQAMANQAAGTVSESDARILMQNALLMGYVPANHHLRHGGHTVSFYRGPFVPLAVHATAPPYYPGPDAASAYDPQTGLFDVSYGAAWQLGQPARAAELRPG